MIKVLLGLYILFIVVGCDSSESRSPSTGISSNPNFVKGKISDVNGTPVDSALVTFSNDEDSITDYTNKFGEFEVSIDENRSYNLSVIYEDSLVYNSDSFSATSINGDFLINLEVDIKDESLPDVVEDSIPQDVIDTIFTEDIKNNEPIVTEKDSVIVLNSSSTIHDTYIRYLITKDNDEDDAGDNAYTNFSNVMSAYVGHYDKDDNCRYLAKLQNIDEYKDIEYSKVEIRYITNLASSSVVVADSKLKLHYCDEDWDIDEVTAIEYEDDREWETIGLDMDDRDAEEEPFFDEYLSGLTEDVTIIDENGNTITERQVSIDITDAFKEWQSGRNNYGFIMTFAESKMEAPNSIFTMETSEASYKAPTLHFIK